MAKVKTCKWWIVIGNTITNKILSIQKVTLKSKIVKSINLICPLEIDNSSIKVYILSDSYFGLDQEYSLPFLSRNKYITSKYYTNSFDDILSDHLKKRNLTKVNVNDKEEGDKFDITYAVTDEKEENEEFIEEDIVYDNW